MRKNNLPDLGPWMCIMTSVSEMKKILLKNPEAAGHTEDEAKSHR